MNMKKNIILFTGRDTYGIEWDIQRWIWAFATKHSDMNIEHIYLDTLKNNESTYRQNILSGGLFSEKRLFVISWGNEKRDKSTDFKVFFTEVFDSLPDDHFLLFYNLTERAKDIIPLIDTLGDVKVYNTVFDATTWEKRFPSIERKIIQTIVKRYESMESILDEWDKNTAISHTIAGTLSNIEILSLTETIDADDIEALIGTDGSGKIFDFVDAIQAVDTKKSLMLLHKIASTKSMFAFLPSCISLLRNTLYAKFFAIHGVSRPNLPIHAYVLQKAVQSSISYEQICRFFHHLVRTDIAYKSGKWMKDSELWMLFEIELAIIWLKK